MGAGLGAVIAADVAAAFPPMTVETGAATQLAQAAGVLPAQVQAIHDHTHRFWPARVFPALVRYTRIPCVTQDHNPKWQTDGHMEKAVKFASTWIERQKLQGATVHVFRKEGLAPVILVDVAGTGDGKVLVYGHLDKQPGTPSEWGPGLHPWKPVLREGRLFGRGVADDSYAGPAAVAALKALQDLGIPHPPTTIILESAEESGSPGLEEYLNDPEIAGIIGTPGLVLGLDSGTASLKHLTVTTSLRGVVGGVLNVETLVAGGHSGLWGGAAVDPVVASWALLSRLVDFETQRIIPRELHIEIPPERIAEARALAAVLGEEGLRARFSALPGTDLLANGADVLLRSTWHPSFTPTAQAGLPPLKEGAPQIQARNQVAFSVRVPPTLDPQAAIDFIKRLLLADNRFRARVSVTNTYAYRGWQGPPLSPDFSVLVHAASSAFFGNPYLSMGLGGSIPFMYMLGERFPGAEIVPLGVLDDLSHEHAPDESIHLSYAQRFTAAIAFMIAGRRR